MKHAVILNGLSLAKNTFYKKIFFALKSAFPVDVFETRSKNDAVLLASKAVEKRYDLIISAGGDGTTHQVVNGILQHRETFVDLPVIGVLPIGTGNDFARTIHAPAEAEELIKQIRNFNIQDINVGAVEYFLSPHVDAAADKKYFINVVDAGMGPEVVQKVLQSGRPFGSGAAYFTSIISTFFTYQPMMLHAKSEEWEWHSKMRTFAVANGKFYGNGLCIAPDAVPGDDQFEIFACGDVSVLDFISQSIPLKKGKHVKHSKVVYKSAKAIHLTSDRPCKIEADGELLGWLPAKIEMMKIKLKFLR